MGGNRTISWKTQYSNLITLKGELVVRNLETKTGLATIASFCMKTQQRKCLLCVERFLKKKDMQKTILGNLICVCKAVPR